MFLTCEALYLFIKMTACPVFKYGFERCLYQKDGITAVSEGDFFPL